MSFSASYGAALAVALGRRSPPFSAPALFTLVTIERTTGSRAGKSAARIAETQSRFKEIRRLGAAAIAYNSTIKIFTSKYGQIAKTYLSNQGGAVCTSAADCARSRLRVDKRRQDQVGAPRAAQGRFRGSGSS